MAGVAKRGSQSTVPCDPDAAGEVARWGSGAPSADQGGGHLGCPRCGYDLFGIPERRCPECGFGFTYAALRELGAESFWVRWYAAYEVISRSALAAATALFPAVAPPHAVWFPFAFLLLALWIKCADRTSWLVGFPVVIPLVFGLTVLFAVLAASIAPVAWVLMTLMVLRAWNLRLRHWPHMANADSAATEGEKATLARLVIGANLAILIATGLWLVALIR